MGSYQNPVPPPDPYERYRIESVGKEPHKQNPDAKEEPASLNNRWGVGASILASLKRIFKRFLKLPVFLDVREKAAHKTLRSLKTAFDVLKLEDRSEDIEFLRHLSNLWLALLEEGNDDPMIRGFLKEIERYPEYQVHTFGYYLSEYAGQQWIPFPYMELLHDIHKSHEKSPSDSALTKWTQQIEQLLLKADS